MSVEAARPKSTASTSAPPIVAPVQPVAQTVALQVQARNTRVSSPHDAAEKEAEGAAKRIMRMEAPSVARFGDTARLIQRHGGGSAIARQGDGIGGSAAPTSVMSAITGGRGAGSPLGSEVRGFMESRFRADFSQVRVHTDAGAARLARDVSARAFTYGSDIYFGRDQYRPESGEGRALLAHELTHTIQQGASPQQPPIQRSADERVTQTSAPSVQRLGIGDALDFFARQANNIPGFRMFTIVIGVNPINMSRVDRSAANILRAVVEFIPGGGLIVQALDNYGVFDRAGRWVEQQLASLGISGQSIKDAITRFLDSLGWRDIFDLGGVWRRAVNILSDPVNRILRFVGGLAGEILRMIKDAVLRPLANLASQTRAWDLLCAVLGRNPITGEAVPRTAETLIGGFMKLIGQEEIWENIKRANAIARAWAWFQGALSGLMGLVSRIPQMFLDALAALEIADLVLLPRAFMRVGQAFAGFIGEFLSWAGTTIWNLLEIIFEVLAPAVMPYLRRAAAAFRTILRNPIGFVGNLVRAGMQGFRQFAGNFLRHLRASLIGWITGALSGAGVYIPQAFTLREIIKFVLSVLGLTWQNIRQKLVRAVGETAVRALETGFDIVMTLVTQGPAAAWEKIQESLTNLREMVMEQIMTFVRDRIITAAVTRLVSMLSPAGAFIQAIIAIYNTVMFFIERLRQIAQVAMSFIDSIAAIAGGNLAAAANRVEQTMAGLLTLVISFLARLVGLGRVSDAVTNVVNRVRAPIDRALDRVVDWIVATARRLGRMVVNAVSGGPDTRTPEQKQRDLDRAVRELRPQAEALLRRGLPRPLLNARFALWKRQYRLTSIDVEGGQVMLTINPRAPMYSVEEILIGRVLEPRLVTARGSYLRDLQGAGPSSGPFAQQLAAAEAAVRGGAPAPARLDSAQINILLDRLRGGQIPVQQSVSAPLVRVPFQPVPRQPLLHPSQGFQIEVRASTRGGPPQAPNFYLPNVGSYAAGHLPGMPAPLPFDPSNPQPDAYDARTRFNWNPPAGPSVNLTMEQGQRPPEVGGLRVLESGRAPGGLPAARLANALQSAGVLSEQEITYGRAAGMALPGSSVQGEAAFRRAAAGQAPLANAPTRVRHGSYGVLFQTLRQTLIQDQTKLITVVGGNSLVQLGEAFDRWLQSAIRDQAYQESPDERAAANVVQQRLLTFLHETPR